MGKIKKKFPKTIPFFRKFCYNCGEAAKGQGKQKPYGKKGKAAMKRTNKVATVWQTRNGETVWKIKRVVYEKGGVYQIRIEGSYYTPDYIVSMGYGVDIGVC